MPPAHRRGPRGGGGGGCVPPGLYPPHCSRSWSRSKADDLLRLEEVVNLERDHEGLQCGGKDDAEGIHSTTVTGMKQDGSGARAQPAVLQEGDTGLPRPPDPASASGSLTSFVVRRGGGEAAGGAGRWLAGQEGHGWMPNGRVASCKSGASGVL
ncbi:hypothetical protein PLESTB_001292600 [Pleodorina starrii]|uniref:Uncharacterized protein n=1 Tax=Pleodorina starrii TaxID=330485 RepID=A0A9W6F6B7_9CHLO|nr:hypothetical protein PLESTB_001292600 [Pleodorina starrii]